MKNKFIIGGLIVLGSLLTLSGTNSESLNANPALLPSPSISTTQETKEVGVDTPPTSDTNPLPHLSPSPTPLPATTSTPKPTIKPTTTPTVKPTFTPTTSGGEFSCNCSKTCPNMISCAEAQYQLNVCGCGARDSDKDGIACDSDCQ